MDLKDLKPKSDTIQVELYHPATYEPLLTEDGKQMMIEIYAPHSLPHKEVVHEQGNRQLEKMQKNKGKYKLTVQELEDFSVERLSKVTKDWVIQLNGQKPKFTVTKAVELYKDFPWIKDQVEEAISDNASFFETLISDLGDFAEHEFQLNLLDDQGISKRAHLQEVERQIGHAPEELNGPEAPMFMENVWFAFIDLCGSRQSGMAANPISFQEIQAWSQLQNTPLRPWEVTAIRRLDDIFIKVNTNG